MSQRRHRGAFVVLVAVVATACAVAAGPTTEPDPRLLLISFDGFRHDYPERATTPNLDALGARGVRASALIPPFPSKTFPGHYTLATGLYPGHHGIISNNMRDPGWPEVFGLGHREEVQEARWWGGEPIWVTAQRQGLRSGVFFWPGSEAPAGGQMPTHWFPYDGTVSYERRVEQALEWLAEPAASRSHLVALYFDEPNEAGHDYGPDAPETVDAIERADAILGQLFDGLRARGTLESTNVVVVADHGMAQNDRSRVIVLDELFALRPHEVFDQGAVVQLYPDPEPGRAEAIYQALHGAHPHLSVYWRADLPERLHLYDHPRLPPILAIADSGWEALTAALLDRTGGHIAAGDHGQDPAHPDMQAIFYAAGPAFASGVEVPPIEAVDVYNLLAAALGVVPADNDGSHDRVRGILRGRP